MEAIPNKRFRVVILLLSVIAAFWFTFMTGTIFLVACSVLAALFLKKFLPEQEFSLVTKVFVAGLALRYVLVIIYYLFFLSRGYMDILGPDGQIYIQRGWYISRILLGQDPYLVPNKEEFIFKTYSSLVDYYGGRLPSLDEYQIGLHSYFIGILFSFFGYSPLIMHFINSVFSVMTGVVVYLIGRDLFNQRIAGISMVMFTFLPSALIFSITGLKESFLVFLIIFLIFLLMSYEKMNKLYILLGALTIVLIIWSIREQLAFPLLVAIYLSFILKLNLSTSKKVMLISGIILFCIFIFSSKVKMSVNPVHLFNKHIGYITTPGYNYKFLPEAYYAGKPLLSMSFAESFFAFLNSIFSFLFRPLPFEITNPRNLWASLQSFILLLVFPFFLKGLFLGLRHKASKMIPIIIYLVFFIVGMSISEGNFGTAFRHREMFMPFFIIFSVAGFWYLVKREEIFPK